DGERLDRRTRQLFRLHGLVGEKPGQVVRGAERPFVADMDEIDAARGILYLQPLEGRAHVNTRRQMPGKSLLIERLGCGEKERFQHPKLFRPGLGRHIRLLAVPFLVDLYPQLGKTRHQYTLPADALGPRDFNVAHDDVSASAGPTPARLRT